MVNNDKPIHENISVLENIAGELTKKAEYLGDGITAASLREYAPKLGLGLVRVVFLGVSSVGKSTVLNALMGKLLVPENPNTSSPIPVWMSYAADGREGVRVTKTVPGPKQGQKREITDEVTAEEFQKKYCYNLKHIVDDKRSDFDNIRFGAIKTQSGCLESGAVFIDTLGIGVSRIDNAKTLSLLAEGTDIAVWVTSNVSLSTLEIDFIRTYLMGMNEESYEVAVHNRIAPQNILFVLNNKSLQAQPTMSELEEVIKEDVFKGCGLSEDKLKDIIKNNVFCVNALQERLSSCGVYPYEKLAPQNSPDEAVEVLREVEENEQDILDDYLLDYDSEEELKKGLAEESGFKEFTAGLETHIGRLMNGVDSAAVRRICTLEKINSAIRSAVDLMTNNAAANNADIQKKIDILNSIVEDLEKSKAKINKAAMNLKNEFADSFMKHLASKEDKIREECLTVVFGLAPPKNLLTWKVFCKLSPNDRVKYILGLISDVKLTRNLENKWQELISSYLDETNPQSQTPGNVLEESKKYVDNSYVALTATIDKLKEEAALDNGIALPDSNTMISRSTDLKAELEEQMYTAIRGGFEKMRVDFEQNAQLYVQNVNWLNWLGNLIGGLLAGEKNALWSTVRDKVFIPFTEKLLASAMETIKNGGGFKIRDAAESCYNDLAGRLRDDRTTLQISAKNKIGELRNILAGKQAVSDKVSAEYAKIAAECGETEALLESMIARLNK